MTGTYEYDVFGGVRAQTGATTERSYTGEQNDPTGLEYLRARYYDASTGRFLSQDPLPLMQRYAYANDNPANLVDPSGLTPFAELMAAERAVQAATRQILSDPCWKTRAFCKHVALVWKESVKKSRRGVRFAADQFASVSYGGYFAAYETLDAINDLPARYQIPVRAGLGVEGHLFLYGVEAAGLAGNVAGDAVEKYIGGVNEPVFDDHTEKPAPCFVPGARPNPRGGCSRFLPGIGRDEDTGKFGFDFRL